MGKYIYVFLFIVILIPIALYVIFKPMIRQNKLLNGVINYDTFKRKFVFSIELSKEEFYSQLKIHNVKDCLDYCLNEDYSTISFIKHSGKYQYKMFIEEDNGVIVLRLEQIAIASKAVYFINEFFIKKFNATPLEYEKYSF